MAGRTAETGEGFGEADSKSIPKIGFVKAVISCLAFCLYARKKTTER